MNNDHNLEILFFKEKRESKHTEKMKGQHQEHRRANCWNKDQWHGMARKGPENRNITSPF